MPIGMDKLIPPALLPLAPGIKAKKEIEPERISDKMLRTQIRSMTTSTMFHRRTLMTDHFYYKITNSK